MIVQTLIGPITQLLDKFIEDKDQKAKLAHELATMSERHAQEIAQGQIEVNKAEATSRSTFVAGWRPFIGWTCGVALAWHFVLYPVVSFLVILSGEVLPPLPVFDMDSLMTILLGMLGLGGLRTFEKFKGVSK
jgi:hypothetical protein